MRTALLLKHTGASAGALLALRDLQTATWKNYWLKATQSGGVNAFDVYGSRADLDAAQTRLASASGVANGDPVTVTFTKDPAAPYDVTPLRGLFGLSGTWTSAIVGWVDDPENHCCQRIADLLAAYQATNEALAPLQVISLGALIRPSAGLPCVNIMPAGDGTTAFTNGMYDLELPIDVEIVNAVLDDLASLSATVSLAGTVRSILLDEQRTLGGLVNDVRPGGGNRYRIVAEEDGSFTYRATVPVRARLAELVASVNTTGSRPGQGGKYTSGL